MHYWLSSRATVAAMLTWTAFQKETWLNVMIPGSLRFAAATLAVSYAVEVDLGVISVLVFGGLAVAGASYLSVRRSRTTIS